MRNAQQNGPGATFVATEEAVTQAVCGTVIWCDLSSERDSSPVTGEFDSDTRSERSPTEGDEHEKPGRRRRS
jgi:hypothetical protein